MGCRDCNSSLETAQNQVAQLSEQLNRAAGVILLIGGVLDEYEDEVRTIREPSAQAAVEKLSTVASSALTVIHQHLEDWMQSEEEARV